MTVSRKVAALPALALALTVGSALAQADVYQFRFFAPGIKTTPAPQTPEVPVPPSGPSLVGDGVSKAGACAAGQTGCAILNAASIYPAGEMNIVNSGLTAMNTNGNQAMALSSATPSSGKWYFESQLGAATKQLCGPGLMPTAAAGTTSAPDSVAPAAAAYRVRPEQINASPYNGKAWGFNWAGGIVGIAMDLDSSTVSFRGPTGTYGPFSVTRASATPYSAALVVWAGCTLSINFGQSDFTYPVPAGFNAGLW